MSGRKGSKDQAGSADRRPVPNQNYANSYAKVGRQSTSRKEPSSDAAVGKEQDNASTGRSKLPHRRSCIGTKSAPPSVGSRFRGEFRQQHTASGNDSSSHEDAMAGIKEDEKAIPYVEKLSLDMFCKCVAKLESTYDLVACASVCRDWRDALKHDMIWKTLYKKWWEVEEVHEGLANCSWRDLFISRYAEGRQRLLYKEKCLGEREGLIQCSTGRVDLLPGVDIPILARQLSLKFYISINHDKPTKICGKASVFLFPSSYALRCPLSTTRTPLTWASLRSIEVVVLSHKLSRSCSIGTFSCTKPRSWEKISVKAPLRLLQLLPSDGASLLVGSLLEDKGQIDEEDYGNEQILLIRLSIHLRNVIQKIMGSLSGTVHRIHYNQADPFYGLCGYRASIQISNLTKVIWERNFPEVSHSRESVTGTEAVFLLISSHEPFPGNIELSWRSDAFSGVIEGAILLSFMLWDVNLELVWHLSKVIKLHPVTSSTFEYVPAIYEGNKLAAQIIEETRGISLDISFSVPFSDKGSFITRRSASACAISTLKFSLERRFLTTWFGVSNI